MELLVPFVSIAAPYTTTPLPAGRQSPEDEEELGDKEVVGLGTGGESCVCVGGWVGGMGLRG